MRRPAPRFPWFILNTLYVLPIGCVIALAWANTMPESYYRFSHAMDFPVNAIGVVFFFAIMTKEVVEATLPGGVLHTWRRAALPLVAAAGGAVASIAVYLGFLQFLSEPALKEAWVVTAAVDVAAAYLVGGLIFGRHPAVPFLLLMALGSNAIGLAILAAFHPASPIRVAIGLALVALGIGAAIVMRQGRVRSFWAYIGVAGGLSWFGFFVSGVHPALALVPIVPFMPHAIRDAGLFVDPTPHDRDTLSRFERWWAPPVQAVLFLFGLVNGGVPLHGLEAGMWALPVGMLIGRPLGALVAAETAIALGLHRTPRVGWKELIVVGVIGAVGLTVGLFFATDVFAIGPLLQQTKTGALISVGAVLFAFALAGLLRVGRFRPESARDAHRSSRSTP